MTETTQTTPAQHAAIVDHLATRPYYGSTIAINDAHRGETRLTTVHADRLAGALAELRTAGLWPDAQATPAPARKLRRMFTMTQDDYQDASNDNGGFCIACGEQAYGVEPDARGYACESCDAPKVYGLEELLLAGRIIITD